MKSCIAAYLLVIRAKIMTVRKMVSRISFLLISCCFCFQLHSGPAEVKPRSALDIDKYVKGLTFGKRGGPKATMDEEDLNNQLLSALDLDKFVKKLTFGKRSGDMTADAELEKKSFASYRWRPVDGW